MWITDSIIIYVHWEDVLTDQLYFLKENDNGQRYMKIIVYIFKIIYYSINIPNFIGIYAMVTSQFHLREDNPEIESYN